MLAESWLMVGSPKKFCPERESLSRFCLFPACLEKEVIFPPIISSHTLKRYPGKRSILSLLGTDVFAFVCLEVIFLSW